MPFPPNKPYFFLITSPPYRLHLHQVLCLHLSSISSSIFPGRFIRCDRLHQSTSSPISSTGMSSHMRTYRGWTSIEDAKLVDALLNMVNVGGFKSDNGFKSGYLLHLEQAMKESLPESGLLGKPHIESRIKTMKKDWQEVYDMMNSTSGFGYDKERNCVTTNADGVWEAYLENHKWARKWKHKKLPHYEELCIIFGKDCAQGNRAKSVIEMEEDANKEQEEDDDFDEDMEDNNP